MIEEMKIKISNYASTQFDLPNEIKTEIDIYFKELIDKKDIANPVDLPDYAKNGIVTDKSHITVLYGIKDGMEERVKEITESKKKISVIFGKTKVFETSYLNYDVLYLDILSLGIRRLRKAFEKEISYANSPFSFTPHCTIVYLKKGLGKKYEKDARFEGIRINLNELTYSPSEGENTFYQLKG